MNALLMDPFIIIILNWNYISKKQNMMNNYSVENPLICMGDLKWQRYGSTNEC